MKTTILKTLSTIRICPDDLILLTLGGSYAYHLQVEQSDIDIRGILKPTEKEFFGFSKDSTIVKVDSEKDISLSAFKRVFYLLSKCSPMTLELFGMLPEEYIIYTDTAKEIKENIDIFLSKEKIEKSFIGYSKGAMHDSMKELLQKGDKAKAAKRLSHVIRILLAGIYILETHDISCYLSKHIDLLMSIKQGKYITEYEIDDKFYTLYEQITKVFYKALETSTIPDKVDTEQIEKFLMQLAKKELLK